MIDSQQKESEKEDLLKEKELQQLFSERKRVYIKISGKVHGVLFRAYVKNKADELGLTGYVKNTDDFVEVVAEGDKTKLRKLILACQKGAPLSQVAKTEYDWFDYSGKFKEFYVKCQEPPVNRLVA